MERDLAMRQLAVKDSTCSSKSWFIMLQETLLPYNLPSALLENPSEKKILEIGSKV